jgi:hypothetical protein
VSIKPIDTQESVWHLRAALNVASLSCQGTAKIGPAYRTLLVRHRRLIASALASEQRQYGAAEFDRHQTWLYNRFANQRLPATFCRTAAGVAERAGAMDLPSLATASGGMVAELEANLR